MGIRNPDREVIERLHSKTLDARFTTEIEQGLKCSPFEAEAVLDVVKEVYSPSSPPRPPNPPQGRSPSSPSSPMSPPESPSATARSRPFA